MNPDVNASGFFLAKNQVLTKIPSFAHNKTDDEKRIHH